MQALKLINKNSCILPYSLGSEIGFGGADGQCFEIINQPNLVIKLSVLYEEYLSSITNQYKVIENNINYLISNPIVGYVRVYTHEYLGSYKRFFCAAHNNEQEYILYYYVMEKLNKISEDEKKVFHTILSHEDSNIIKDLSYQKINKTLSELSRGLDFDYEKILYFCDNIKKSPIQHLDMHSRNVMKDELGNFKLIDLERLEFKDGKEI